MNAQSSRHETRNKPFRVLMVAGVYPTEQRPHSGTFIKTQVESLLAEGIGVEVIHPKPGPVPLRYICAALEVFFKTLTGRYDIVNGHYGLWCLAARMQWTTPVVASFLGGDLLGELYPDGGSQSQSNFVVWISRWLCHHVDAVIVKSEGMKKAAAGNNIHIIPNGVDFTLFRPLPRLQTREILGWKQDGYYILFGNDPRLPSKNFSLAQLAVERLCARGVPAELVIANGLPQANLVQYMNACNALILTSLYEGSPNIVKEAMACNLPVVSTFIGDVLQVIGETKGCKVCPDDPDALAEALEEAVRYSEPTTGRRDIAHLESTIVAKQVIELFEQTKNKKRKEKER